jgi:outer membrane protein OmpA-like peptidoglycan-associated protein
MVHRLTFLVLLVNIFRFTTFHAQKFSGTWQGFYQEDTTISPEKMNAIYFNLNVINGLADAKCKIEPYQKNEFGVYLLNGQVEFNSMKLNFSKKIKEVGVTQGEFSLQLSYNPTNGYLSGQVIKKGQTSSFSKVVLYKQGIEWKETHQETSHVWVDRLKKDVKNGVSSPTVRKEELKSFAFQPVFFDYDEFAIRKEFKTYLLEIVKMLNSHSDLRLRITGHTDGDGSNSYNLTLSKNRAKSLIEFFIACGIEKSRIVIDFKGENNPVDSNDSEEGKRRNRRVDFEFI